MTFLRIYTRGGLTLVESVLHLLFLQKFGETWKNQGFVQGVCTLGCVQHSSAGSGSHWSYWSVRSVRRRKMFLEPVCKSNRYHRVTATFSDAHKFGIWALRPLGERRQGGVAGFWCCQGGIWKDFSDTCLRKRYRGIKLSPALRRLVCELPCLYNYTSNKHPTFYII